MSVEEHKEAAGGLVGRAQVVVVSSTRTAASDESGARLATLLEAAGHEVLGRQVVDDDLRAVRQVVVGFAADGHTNLVVLTGGTGISRRDVTAEAVEPLFDSPIPGFGELFRMLSYEQIGSAAMLSRATAGMVGPLLVFALPGSQKAVELAAEKLILPEIAHLLRELAKESPPESQEPPSEAYDFEDAEPEEIEAEIVDEDEDEEEASKLAPPTGRLGVLGRGKMTLLSEEVVRTEEAEPEGDERPVPSTGWRRAAYEVGGEILRDKREDLPWDLESVSPVVDVLHTAGEVAVMKLDSGVKFSLYGWPDLRRDTSRVLAVGWGQPLAEIVALHRYPHMTGTCIEEERGLLPARDADVEEVCTAVTGSAPSDLAGAKLFAVQADTVWYERKGHVYRWDGRREHDDGVPKQTIASLVLHWSNR